MSGEKYAVLAAVLGIRGYADYDGAGADLYNPLRHSFLFSLIDIKFLHKIVEGGTDDSYGIEVAKLAGLPQKVINSAKQELKGLEVIGKMKLTETLESTAENQFSFTAINEQNAIARLRAADINSMSPMDALLFVKELKDTL